MSRGRTAQQGNRQQRQAPKPRARRPAPIPRPRAPSAPATSLATALAKYDPRSLAHLPGPRATAPYTVVRERINFPLATNTPAGGHAGQNTVAMIGPFLQGPGGTTVGERMASTIAVHGLGGFAPGVTETLVTSALFNGAAAQTKTVSLHSFHVEVICTGTSAGTVPAGNVWCGAITQPISRLNGWASYDAIAEGVKTRRGMKQYSAYELMATPVNLMSYPLDSVSHSEFLWMSGAAGSGDELFRSLTPVVVVLGPTSAAVDYSITAVLEWRMREALDPLLQSTHRHFTPVSESVWAQLSNHLSTVGGLVKSAAQHPAVQGALRAAVAAGVRNAPQALPMLLNAA